VWFSGEGCCFHPLQFGAEMGYIILFCILFLNAAWEFLTTAGYICLFIKEFSV
jgi:hypothetical protein